MEFPRRVTRDLRWPALLGASHEMVQKLLAERFREDLVAVMRFVLVARNDGAWRPAFGRIDIARSSDLHSIGTKKFSHGVVLAVEKVSRDRLVAWFEEAFKGVPVCCDGYQIVGHGMEGQWRAYWEASDPSPQSSRRPWPCFLADTAGVIPNWSPEPTELIEGPGSDEAYNGLSALIDHVGGFTDFGYKDIRRQRISLGVWDYRGRILNASFSKANLTVTAESVPAGTLKLVACVKDLRGEETRLKREFSNSVSIPLPAPVYEVRVALRSPTGTEDLDEVRAFPAAEHVAAAMGAVIPGESRVDWTPVLGSLGTSGPPSESTPTAPIPVRQTRAQLLDLQRDLSKATLGTFSVVAVHVQDFADALPRGALQDELRGHASAIAQASLSDERRAIAQRAIGVICRRLHQEAIFQPSQPVGDAAYGAILRAAIEEDFRLPTGAAVSIDALEERSRLAISDVHAAVGRTLDEGLAKPSGTNQFAYSIELEREAAQLTLQALGDGEKSISHHESGGRSSATASTPAGAQPDVDLPMRIWTKNIADYRGKIHFAIITIKREEEDEVLLRFPREHSVRGERDYGLSRVRNVQGDEILIASVRQPQQGNIYANDVTKDVVRDLDPEWILLVGIAGATPFGDATLGDVVLGTHIHDLTVHARDSDGSVSFAAKGGSATVEVESTVAHQRSVLAKDVAFPKPSHPLVLDELRFTTKDKEINKKIEQTLRARFGNGYSPRILDGAIVSTDTLVKDPELVQQWRDHMRNALAIEMESAGAYNAARTRAKQYAMLPIRGISDVVGMEKQEGWVLHACKAAAECALHFVRTWSPPSESLRPPR